MYVLMAHMDYEGGQILGLFETKEAAIEARKSYRTGLFESVDTKRFGDYWDEYSVIECPIGEILPTGGLVVDRYRAKKPNY